jgi:hypothetical protein
MKQKLLFLLLLGAALGLAACRPDTPSGQSSSGGAAAPGAVPPPLGAAALPAGAEKNPFFGKWASVNDPKEVVTLSGDRFESAYQGAKMVDKPLAYYNQCPSKCTGEDAPAGYPCFALVAEGSGSPNCYAITQIDAQTIEIKPLASKGQGLRYRRL